MAADPGFDGGLALAFGTKDRKRAAGWYRDVLGFEVVYDDAEHGFCELSTPLPGVTVVLSEVEEVQAGVGAVPTFGVRDVDSVRSALESRGVRFDGETEEVPGVVKLATMYDLDGNALMLSQDFQRGG